MTPTPQPTSVASASSSNGRVALDLASPGCESLPTRRARYTGDMTQAPAPIRVVIAEDNRDLAGAVQALLQAEPDMEVVGKIERAERLLETVRDSRAHVVVLDLNLAGESSVPALRGALRALPCVAFVIYSGYDRGDLASALPGLGAVEFVSKTGDVATLLQAVRRAAGK